MRKFYYQIAAFLVLFGVLKSSVSGEVNRAVYDLREHNRGADRVVAHVVDRIYVNVRADTKDDRSIGTALEYT